jgi:hypothetical protein
LQKGGNRWDFRRGEREENLEKKAWKRPMKESLILSISEESLRSEDTMWPRCLKKETNLMGLPLRKRGGDETGRGEKMTHSVFS